MGERAKKKRAADARAAKKAKMTKTMDPASTASAKSTSSEVPTQSNAKNSKKPGTAPRVPSAPPRQSTRSSTRSLGSSSTLSSAKKHTSTDLEGTDNGKTRPLRATTAVAMALLQELQFSETEETEGDPRVLTGNDSDEVMITESAQDEDEDLEDSGSGDDLGDEGSDDGSEVEVIEEPVAQVQKNPPKVVPAVQKKLNLPAIAETESSSDSDEFEVFDMTFEINDKARGARKNVTLPSFTSWDNLKDRVAQVLNRHPESLHLQYRFSNEKSNSLPFDLVSLTDYDEMRDKLKPFVIPKILANGKPSKSARKLVIVQLFDKGMEGVPQAAGGEKIVKKPLKAPGDDTSMTKQDEMFEKKKTVIEQLTNYWHCEIHSLPGKPTLCWKPTDQRPHGECYPITQSNINFWASCIVREPTTFSVEEKPRQLNLLNNMPRRHGSSGNSTTQAQAIQPAFPMPYGFYPPPNPFFANPMQWPGAGPVGFPQPSCPQPHGVPQANPTMPPRHVRGPRISHWLAYCDHVPGRDGEFFFGLVEKFDQQGYRTIDQLTSSRMSVENLSNWLEIGKGTADLIIQYAEEDMALVRDGKFTMEPAHGAEN